MQRNENEIKDKYKQDFSQYLSYLSRYASPTLYSVSPLPSLSQSNDYDEQEIDNSQFNQLIEDESPCEKCGRPAPNLTYVKELTTNQFLLSSNNNECDLCANKVRQLKDEANRQRQAEAPAAPSPLSFRSATTIKSPMSKRSAFRPYNRSNFSFPSSSSSLILNTKSTQLEKVSLEKIC